MKNSILPILFLGFIIILSAGCEKEQAIEPIIHNSQEFDLNNDNTNDIKISYIGYSWDGIGPNGSGMGINGILEPLDNTLILNKQNIVSMFLSAKDTIKLYNSTGFSWASNDFHLVSIKTDLNQYVNPWTVNSPEVKDFYVIGFKILSNNIPTIGWLKLKIDCYNGKINITETKTTIQDYLVID
jgi:hypothetical protein